MKYRDRAIRFIFTGQPRVVYHTFMTVRVLLVLALLAVASPPVFAGNTEYFYLTHEPLVRIGLTTNARSISITTSDTQLVAYSPDEQNRYLATNKVSVSARADRPPEVENYRFEIQNLPTAAETDELAKEIREETGAAVVTQSGGGVLELPANAPSLDDDDPLERLEAAG